MHPPEGQSMEVNKRRSAAQQVGKVKNGGYEPRLFNLYHGGKDFVKSAFST